MMRVGWLADETTHVGGAELTSAEFRASAPDGVEIVDCRAGESIPSLDIYVVQNCVTYPLDYLQELERFDRVVKYHHDVGPHMQPGVMDWLREHATNICCSPIQREYMGLTQRKARMIPPPINVERFSEAAAKSNGTRAGAVCIGSWRNYGKAPHKAAEWGDAHGGVDFFGGGQLAPPGSREIPTDAMPALLASYATFVFLPTVIEPFGRLVAEAWAAGCDVVTNGLVGARYWIEENPEGIETAAADFWAVVLG